MMKDEECIMKDDDFKLLRGFGYGLTDICDCRVAFATENLKNYLKLSVYVGDIRKNVTVTK